MRERIFVLVSIVGLCFLAAAQSAAAQAPEGEAGVSLFVPLSSDGGIVIDGDLVDWRGVPIVFTTGGPDPADSGELSWQVAADGEHLYFAATVVDSSIVAGQHGDNYWNEDSIEFYVNFSPDANATTYGPGIAQITVSPIDIGNDDPASLTISGNNSSSMSLSGFVFATANGWGVEVALELSGLTAPQHRESFGLQVQVNGSSGGDRDTKLSWSTADVNDTSFQDPSVFGTAIFFDELVEAIPAQTDVQGEIEPDDAAVVDEAADVVADVSDEPQRELVTGDVETTDAVDTQPGDPETSGNRPLLIAAIVSVVSIMVGGLWFERRRKLSESQLALGAGAQPPEDGN